MDFTISTLDHIDVNWPILAAFVPTKSVFITDTVAKIYYKLGSMTENQITPKFTDC